MDSSTSKTGKITGAYNYDGGAVDVMRSYGNNVGFLTMTGGNITGGWNSTAGSQSGGVYAGGTFIMAGGEISGNNACGGIFHDSNSFTVGGLGAAVVIRNNQSGCTFDASAGTVSGGITDNVYVRSGKKFILAWLAEGTYIGVTTEAAPAKDSPVEISHATNLNYHSLFHSDSENYKIGGKAYADGNYAVQLESTGNLVTITDEANGSGTTAKYGAGNTPIISDATGVSAGRTVTVTPAPSSGYELDKVTVTGTEAPHTEVTVTGNTFTMPDYPVTITVTFKATATPLPTPSDPGGSSDGGYTAYPVSQPSGSGATGGTQTGGSVTLSSDKAKAGDTVTATPKPEKGYELTDLNVKNASGSLIETVKNADGTFNFKMPSSAVTVNPSFSKIQYYHDVSGSAYFADAAWYLRKENIMKGIGETTFSGGEKLNRQQSWMILSRGEGQAPPSMAAAKAWAVSANVSDGSNAGGIVSRQQLAVMLYRAAGSPAVTENKLKDFSDGSAVAAYAKDAMNWTLEAEILTGNGGKLNAADPASRANAAVMFTRYLNVVQK